MKTLCKICSFLICALLFCVAVPAFYAAFDSMPVQLSPEQQRRETEAYEELYQARLQLIETVQDMQREAEVDMLEAELKILREHNEKE